MSISKKLGAIFGKVHNYYRYRLIPGVENFRGSVKVLEFLASASQIGVDKNEESPQGIGELEWDNLIILDACRHDLMEEHLGKNIEYRISKGSTSSEYVSRTFNKGDWSDVVYVNSNGFLSPSKFEELTGRNIEDVFHSVFQTVESDWDEDIENTPPEKVFRDAKSAAKLFNDKKIIIHFMQPHLPFLDSNKGYENKSFKNKGWIIPALGGMEDDEAWQEYKKNLEIVLDYVTDLAEYLDGETYITADHGNFVGENNLYGHPKGSEAEVLRKVPWVKLSEL